MNQITRNRVSLVQDEDVHTDINAHTLLDPEGLTPICHVWSQGEPNRCSAAATVKVRSLPPLLGQIMRTLQVCNSMRLLYLSLLCIVETLLGFFGVGGPVIYCLL